MNYSQKANPNATNSEMDSKIIIKPSKIRSLTPEQRDELIQQFVEIQVDNMDTETLVEWVTDELIYQYGKFTPEELKERVNCYDDNDGLYEELVDNVTQQYPKQVNSFGH